MKEVKVDKKVNFSFKTEVVKYPGFASWSFAIVPKKISDEIKDNIKRRVGFGSVYVIAEIGKTSWETSIFPDKKSGCYLLPLKKEVRKKEDIEDYGKINLKITLRKL